MKKTKFHMAMLDTDIMVRVFGNNPKAIYKYINNFVEITSTLLQKTESAIQQKQCQLALDYLHQLKGPVGSIGFKKMYKLCEKLEEKISQSDWVAAQAVYKEIENALKKLKSENEKKFKELIAVS